MLKPNVQRLPLGIGNTQIGEIAHHNGKPVGVFIAKKVGENHYSVGISVTHHNDTFNRNLGVTVATGRAATGTNMRISPDRGEVEALLSTFKHRAAKYFAGLSELKTTRKARKTMSEA